MSAALTEHLENVQRQQQREDDARQSCIDRISGLYPPDSDFNDTRALGREDVINALCEEWRTLPVPVLEHMATAQHRRDHSI